MATVRRSKTMPADGQTTKFLYTILKQLDLKTIDWNLVASQLEISNGHAARMRFSRFRQHMEGIQTVPRGSKPKETTGKGDTGKGDTRKSGKNGKGAKVSKGDGLFDKGKGKSGSNSNFKKRPVPPEVVQQEQQASTPLFKREPGLNPRFPSVPPPRPNHMVPASLVPAPGNALSTMQIQPLVPRSSPMMTVAPADLTLNHPFVSNPQSVYHNNSTYQNANWDQSDCGFIGCCQPQYPTTPALHPAYTPDGFVSSSANPYVPQIQQSDQLQPQPQSQQAPQNIWQPIKQENEDGEMYDDIFVKTEPSC